MSGSGSKYLSSAGPPRIGTDVENSCPVKPKCDKWGNMKNRIKTMYPKQKKLEFRPVDYGTFAPYILSFISSTLFAFMFGLSFLAVPGPLSNYTVSLVVGFTTLGLIYLTEKAGGAHFNPVATLVQYFLQMWSLAPNINKWWAPIVLILVEIAGAFVGSAILLGFFPASSCLGSSAPGPLSGGSRGVTFSAEMIGTAFIMLIWFYPRIHKKIHPLVTGFAVIAATFLFLYISGSSFNPARSFSANVVTEFADACGGDGDIVWIYYLAPFVGGAIAAFLILIIGWFLGHIYAKEKEPEYECLRP